MKQKNQANKSRQSKQKDENAPKKAKSAYMFYQSECMPKKEQLFGTPEDIKNAGGIMKCIGNKWKELDEGQKEKYKQMAEQDKQRYEKQMKDYKNSGAFQGQEGAAKEKKAKKDEKNNGSESNQQQKNVKQGKKRCAQ